MCGIAGIVNLGHKLSPDEMRNTLSRMGQSMVHRGPDDHGVWISEDGFCGLAHQRLSIIDTSTAGHQPMLTDDRRKALVFNGELYNFEELKEEALAQGETFHSQTDTEVLLKGLEREDAPFLRRVDAMFALGYYDTQEKQLLLARDAFGEKPLYYTEQNGLFAFASELNALTLIPGFDASITPDTISMYLAFQHPPAPHTIYQHCRKLAPGHFMRVGKNGASQPLRHFHFVCEGNAQSKLSLEERADQLEELLLQSLKRRLKSDVPLGAFLSGGVDSSTAVALITKRLNRNVNTFSIGFSDVPESEHMEAQEMADHLGTSHYWEMIHPDNFADQANIAALLDEPNLDTSCVPTYAISALAKKRVTVAITGDGGDEMFGGYGRYWQCLAALEKNREAYERKAWSFGKEYLSRRFLVFPHTHLEEVLGKSPLAAKDYLLDGIQRLDQDVRPPITRLRQLDVDMYLPVVLAKVDRMSMQHSLECRTPYLSPEIAAFASTLTSQELCEGSNTKRVLKAVAKRYFPEDWIDRPKKGFGMAPDNPVIRQAVLSRLQSLTRQEESPLRAFFSETAWQHIMDNYLPNCGFYSGWAFLVLELWLRSHPHTFRH